jgi:hypothetical protein
LVTLGNGLDEPDEIGWAYRDMIERNRRDSALDDLMNQASDWLSELIRARVGGVQGNWFNIAAIISK